MGCCQNSGPREGAEFQAAVTPVPPQGDAGEQLGPAPVWPLIAQRGTPFANFLEAGHMAVVRATYFKECWHRRVPFQDRANIPVEAFIDGKEVVDLWVEFGYGFLVVISYPWLSKGHPDPKCFHLPRLVRALEIFKHYHKQLSWKGDKRGRVLELEGGVILDFCSFWQGERSDEEDRLFKEGLNLINIPYGHRDVTALKLVSTPPTEVRLYDDRGWTHFESTVIDGKAPSMRHDLGKRNVLTCGNTETRGDDVMMGLANFQRKPPLTPLRFREELEVRRERAEAKGERLFTSHKDSPVILDRYDASFDELCRSEKLQYRNMDWGAAEARDLALALPFFGALEDLDLSYNHFHGEAAAALAVALPQCSALRKLDLAGNELGLNGEAFTALAAALEECTTLEDLRLFRNDLGAEAAAALAAALPQCVALRKLDLADNGDLGCNGEAAAALMAALGECARLEDVNLWGDGLGVEAAAALAAALPRCSGLHELDLRENQLGDNAEAFTALAAALEECTTLEDLRLWRNDLGAEAAAALAAALPQCSALRKLDLGDNELGRNGEAFTALAAALVECVALEDLSLENSGLGAEAAVALAAAVPHCRALHTLSLRRNNFSDNAKADLRSAWRSAGKEAWGLKL